MMETLMATRKKVSYFEKYNIFGYAQNRELDTYHLIFAPSFACNMKCSHCYLPNTQNKLINKEEAFRLVDEWADIVREKGLYKGVFHIKGGEPFMLPYFWELIERIIDTKVLKLMITTNGTFNDSETLNKLSLINSRLNENFTIVVSLDGATENSYSYLRKKEAFDNVVNFIENLGSIGIRFNINYVVNKHNFNEIEQFIDFASKNNASQLNFLTLVPKGNATDIEDWQVEHVQVFEKIKTIYNSSDCNTKIMLEGTIQDIRNKEINGLIATSHECVAAYKGLLYIVQNGDVFSCPNLVFDDCKLGNIKDNSIAEIFNKTNELYSKLTCHSGKYVCSGERKLYINTGNTKKKKSLDDFQQYTDMSSFQGEELSFCYNRNH